VMKRPDSHGRCSTAPPTCEHQRNIYHTKASKEASFFSCPGSSSLKY
jgi:hypothetical protein